MKTFKNFMENKEKILIIMRAPPGAGKSFEVDKILKEMGVPKERHVFSTDEFFEKSPDGYIETFRKAKEGGYLGQLLSKYHKMNQERAIEAMSQDVSPIIIDNTNVDLKSMRNYVESGITYGYKIEFKEPSSEHWQNIAPLLMDKNTNAERLKFAALKLANKNQHGVPYEAIQNMFNKWHVNPKVDDFQL